MQIIRAFSRTQFMSYGNRQIKYGIFILKFGTYMDNKRCKKKQTLCSFNGTPTWTVWPEQKENSSL